jgi:hypothetical protein
MAAGYFTFTAMVNVPVITAFIGATAANFSA